MKKIYLGLVLLLALFLTACGKNSAGNKSHDQELSGVYKETEKDAPRDDEGRTQYNYFYFKPDGTVLLAQPETGGDDNGKYGDAEKGTWKRIADDKFQVKIKSIYDKDYYTLVMKKTGDKLTTGGTAKDARYEWDKDSYEKSDMVYADFRDLFINAKKSEQEKINENGYADPDNDSSQDSSATQSDDVDAQERAAAFKNGGKWITDKSDPSYYSDANAYVTYLQIKDGVSKGILNPDGTETPKGRAQDE